MHAHLDTSPKPSYEVILDILKAEPDDSVTIVALGPCKFFFLLLIQLTTCVIYTCKTLIIHVGLVTNIAHSLRADPETFAKVSRVVWMGGAIDHPGNTSPVAEFNCFADPYAAASVVAAAKEGKIELIMAPLDITTPHSIPFSDLIHPSVVAIPEPSTGVVRKTSETPTPLEAFISAMLVRVRSLQANFGLPDAMEMHDPVAVWYALAHAGVPRGAGPVEGWALNGREFTIERTGEYTRGMCVVDRRGTGEVGVDRSKDESILSHGLEKMEKENNALPEKKNGVVKPRGLPLIITRTPGTEALRSTLLGRVFGKRE